MAEQTKVFHDPQGGAYTILAAARCFACKHTAAEHPVADHYGKGRPCPGCFKGCDIITRPEGVNNEQAAASAR